MKSKLMGIAALALITSSAFGGIRPIGERPYAKVRLEQIEGDGRYPRPTELTINRRDRSIDAASFLLVEDTGLRCITTPCPSHKTSKFHVTKVFRTKDGSVLYTANNTPVLITGIIAPGPGHVDRTIQVADHSNNRRLRFKFPWILKLQGKFEAATYGGHPELINTIQKVNP